MTNTQKPKIINIMPHEPAYHYLPDEKPDFWWEKEDGSWLGFWTREWPDLLGEAVLKQTDQYDWEVWQPDYRADKVYSRRLNTGVVHKLFPAQDKVYGSGVISGKGINSESLIEHLSTLRGKRIVLQLHGFPSPLNLELIRIFGPTKEFPIFLLTHGTKAAPIKELFGFHRPLTYLKLLMEQRKYSTVLQYADVIGGQNRASLDNIQMMYHGRIERLNMGCDFDFWIPVPSDEIKRDVRKKLGIPNNRTVFLVVSFFVTLKQLDKLINVFKELSKREDFFLIIVGCGEKSYSDFLHSLARELVVQNKAIFYPYMTGEQLRSLYWVSDVYLSVSKSEGCSVSVIKAMACGLPVLTSPVGGTGDLMKKYGVGKFIPVKNYNKWAGAISEILDKEMPKTLDLGLARDAYDWSNVVKRFIKIFDDLCKKYYGEVPKV